MVRFLVTVVLSLLANAIGLLAAAAFVDSFSIDTLSFVVAVAIFTASTTILGPFIAKLAHQYAGYLMGGIALVNTFVALALTSIFTDGIQIDGVTTWLVATFVVWVFSVIGNVVLPLFMFKKVLQGAKEQKQDNA